MDPSLINNQSRLNGGLVISNHFQLDIPTFRDPGSPSENSNGT